MVNHPESDDLIRLPGLFPSKELPEVIVPECNYRFERSDRTHEGEPLWVVWCGHLGEASQLSAIGHSVRVEIRFEPDHHMAIVRYCDVCRRWGLDGSVHLCGSNWHRRLGEVVGLLQMKVGAP